MSLSSSPAPHRMPPLWVLDVEAEPYYGGFFRDVARRLGELAAKCGSEIRGRSAGGSSSPPIFAVMSKISVSWSRRRLNGSTLNGAWLLAAEIIGSRRVLFTAPVVEKMKIQTIGSALAFKAGDPVETALQTALSRSDLSEVRRATDEPPPGV